jgi:hypothetical protein
MWVSAPVTEIQHGTALVDRKYLIMASIGEKLGTSDRTDRIGDWGMVALQRGKADWQSKRI